MHAGKLTAEPSLRATPVATNMPTNIGRRASKLADYQRFGEAFDRLVRDSGLSAAEIARRLDVYSGQVSHWRRGGGITVLNVRKIADLFGVDRAQLEALAGYPPSPSTSDDSPALAALIAVLRRRWDELQEPEQRAIGTVVRAIAGEPSSVIKALETALCWFVALLCHPVWQEESPLTLALAGA
jgi:hypothetical protein